MIRPLRSAAASISTSMAAIALLSAAARADVHTVRVAEFYTQCNNGLDAVQYIELRPYFANQFFRLCASIQVKRTVGGPDVFFAKPVFAGHTNDEVFATTRTYLIATPAFQAATGIVPDLVMPDGTLDPAGGVIRFAADSGCEPNTNWGTIHEVRYGDQGTAPAPGPHQAANWNNTTGTWSLGNRSPKNFANATVSNWNCDTGAPSVTVISPDGGEVLEVGTLHQIRWSATDDGIITGVTLEYSNNGGVAFNPIATGLPNNGAFDWPVPNDPTTQGLVRVTVGDFAAHSGQDVSNAVFTIATPTVPDTTPPVVTVIRPNGGEIFVIGSEEEIEWTASDDDSVANVDIHYSTNAGGAWNPIATGIPNSGSYLWTVPNDPVNGSALIKVVARDVAQNVAADSSDAPFTLQSVSSVPNLPGVITRPLVMQNRPNPFNPGTFIGFALPAAAHVTIEVFTIGGRQVATLHDRVESAGYHEVFWDGRDAVGRIMPSGIYFYRFNAGQAREVRRMTLTK
jgi:hypothetical protein